MHNRDLNFYFVDEMSGIVDRYDGWVGPTFPPVPKMIGLYAYT